MFDVFTDEIEALIKEGIANLYWFKHDLQRVWLGAGVPQALADRMFALRSPDGQLLTKRELMNQLYLRFRHWPVERRLEVSRNFVRTLVEHGRFTPQDPNHRVEKAEHAALRLREVLRCQQASAERRDRERRAAEAARSRRPEDIAEVNQAFLKAMSLGPQARGYEFERVFNRLMKASGIEVFEPFRIVGEQIDGAIKFDSHFYLVELRWREEPANQEALAGFCYKVEGKLDARGIFISMNGFSSEMLLSLPHGKRLTVLLLDGIHIANVLSGLYSFSRLLSTAIESASLRGDLCCPHDLAGSA
jgi:hypothetical protein